ncbi:hypothetical protein [Lachnospira multipara]|uniref:hypothetical protein n=1 Tax=Lachnospira multipara TaxID=28051 RepID=UPI000482DCB0|nr:hypothetical protein [Lachnospira multipara]
MKKTRIIFLLSLVILIISTLYVPVKAGNLLSIEATTSDTRNIHISGTTDSDVYAIILRIYYLENVNTITTEKEFIAAHKTVDVRSIEVTNGTFDSTIDLGKEFNIFGYNGLLVYASDYDGGNKLETIVQYINNAPTNQVTESEKSTEETANTTTEPTTTIEESSESEAITEIESTRRADLAGDADNIDNNIDNNNVNTSDSSRPFIYSLLLVMSITLIFNLRKNKDLL